jgi:hypothetical protein
MHPCIHTYIDTHIQTQGILRNTMRTPSSEGNFAPSPLQPIGMLPMAMSPPKSPRTLSNASPHAPKSPSLSHSSGSRLSILSDPAQSPHAGGDASPTAVAPPLRSPIVDAALQEPDYVSSPRASHPAPPPRSPISASKSYESVAQHVFSNQEMLALPLQSSPLSLQMPNHPSSPSDPSPKSPVVNAPSAPPSNTTNSAPKSPPMAPASNSSSQALKSPPPSNNSILSGISYTTQVSYVSTPKDRPTASKDDDLRLYAPGLELRKAPSGAIVVVGLQNGCDGDEPILVLLVVCASVGVEQARMHTYTYIRM